MDNYFSPEIDKYFDAWILPDSWDAEHHLDRARFHMFVKALDHYKYEKRRVETLLSDKILAAVERNHKLDREAALVTIDQFVQDARMILDFLDNTRSFPDRQVENCTPH